MATITVKQLAEIVGVSVAHLLAQFKEAGIAITSQDRLVTDQERQILQRHLQRSKAASLNQPGSSQDPAKRLSLRRKSTTEVKTGSIAGTPGKVIPVEVRKKQAYIPIAPAKPVVPSEPIVQPAIPEEKQAASSQVEAPVEAIPTPAPVSTVLPTPAVKPVVPPKPQTPPQTTKPKEHVKKKDKKHPKQTGTFETEEERVFFQKRSQSQKHMTAVAKKNFSAPPSRVVHEVTIPQTITVSELAQKMSIKVGELIRSLLKMGIMATINKSLDQETAILVVEEMGHIPKPLQESALEAQLLEENNTLAEELVPRSPVVTIMGHVDHGKTSLLDYIRKTKVALGEAGGITQHIGAYHVETPKGIITFLDTPGHEAFAAMRARGAQCTDLVVLIVAGDDGVKPQTIEAIKHAKSAQVPIVVAINKMDKPGADPERVKSELAQHEVLAENWGGEVMFVNVSAKTGLGVDELLDTILLQAEVLELKAIPTGPAKGVVIEARLDKGRGPVATLLVQQGELRKGDILLAGSEFGRVRALLNEAGQSIASAGPSIPVEVLGLSNPPAAGDEVIVVKDERKAREIALMRQTKNREIKLARQKNASLENLFQQTADETQATLNIVLKASVQGSVEALSEALANLSTDKIKVNVVFSGTGAITESDVNLAIASNAIIIGFNVRAEAGARALVEEKGIDLRYYSVIYDIIDDVKKAMTGLLSPEFKEQIQGIAQVRDVFRSSKFGTIAGCMVIEGIVKRNQPARVLRDNVVIFEGVLESLKRFKDDASEVRNGMECGIGIKNYSDVRVGDQIEIFESIQIQPSL